MIERLEKLRDVAPIFAAIAVTNARLRTYIDACAIFFDENRNRQVVGENQNRNFAANFHYIIILVIIAPVSSTRCDDFPGLAESAQRRNKILNSLHHVVLRRSVKARAQIRIAVFGRRLRDVGREIAGFHIA